jgi:F-BAR domain only protein
MFSKSIERDVEKPLREYTVSNPELLGMTNVGGNLQNIARDVEAAEKKAEQLRSKGGKASADKVAQAASSVEAAKGQWDSQAPYVFEKLQEVDETRLEHLRSSLTQYQTFATETHSSIGTAAEEALNSLLNIRAADEIQQFAVRAPEGILAQSIRDRRMSRAPSSVASVPSVTPVASNLVPPPIDEESTSQRSNSCKSKQSGNLTNQTVVQEKPKGKLSGLRRLGTVIKSRRNSTHPYGQQLTSPESKRSSTNLGKFGPFSRRKDTSDTLSPEPLERQPTGSRPSTTNEEIEAGPSGGIERAPSHYSEAIPEVEEAPEPATMTNGTHLMDIAPVETMPEAPAPIQPEVSDFYDDE